MSTWRLLIKEFKERWEDGKTEDPPPYTAGGAVGGGGHCRKAVWQFLEKLNTELPYDLEIPPLGRRPRGMNIDPYRNWHTDVPRNVIRGSHEVKTTQVSHQMNGKMKRAAAVQ